ncbi:MAG: sigma-70 family RNA polymerase sigma factor [Bacteroidota bacterium]
MAILRNIWTENNDEASLWQDLLNGDKQSLELIMNEYMDSLFLYGKRFSTDTAFIEDCIQDLFIGIWQRRDYLSATVKIKPYLFSSFRRLILRKIKLSKRIPFTSIEDGFKEFHFEYAIDNKMIKEEEAKSVANKIKKLMDELPKRQKEIIYLKFYESLDRDEISEIMQISNQSVSNLIQKALVNLRSNHDVLPLLLTILIYFITLHF